MKRRNPLARALMFSAMCLPHQAQALLYTCSVTATDVGFGTYSPFNPSAADSTGNVRVSCSLLGLLSLLVNYRIYLSPGSGGAYSPRLMHKGSDTLDYNLYTNASRTTIWGNGSGGTSYVEDGYLIGLFTVSRDYTIYGRVPAEQNVAPGFYSDTLTVTVEYF